MTSIYVFLFFSWDFFKGLLFLTIYFLPEICVLPIYLYPSAYLCQCGERPCPNSILVCRVYMLKLVKVINELCFRVHGMPSLTGRLSLNCHRAGPFSLMAETDKLSDFTGPLVVTPCHPIILWGPDCAAMCHAKHLFVVTFHLWVPATSLSPSCELWDCRRSWPQPFPTWREMCRTNGSRNYTEIGHTGWISKSRALVKVSVAR